MNRRDVIRRWIDACARVAKDESLVAPLARSTGLSVENVRVGLARHLEIDATDAEIDALVARAVPAERVHVILPASVFVAPLRAVALALAASDRVTVRPSRREPVFAEAAARAFGDARVEIVRDEPADIARGEIHVDGLDETVARVRRSARAGVVVRAHGTAMGVAVVTGDFTLAASSLAEDVTAFDQRGCLSPRVAFVTRDADAFARALFVALEARATIVPRGALTSAEIAERATWESTIAFAGALHRGASCAVGVIDETSSALGAALPPSGRHVLVRPLRNLGDLPRALNGAVIAIGTDAPLDTVRALAPRTRVSAFGEMQRPRLDGPVDRRG